MSHNKQYFRCNRVGNRKNRRTYFIFPWGFYFQHIIQCVCCVLYKWQTSATTIFCVISVMTLAAFNQLNLASGETSVTERLEGQTMGEVKSVARGRAKKKIREWAQSWSTSTQLEENYKYQVKYNNATRDSNNKKTAKPTLSRIEMCMLYLTN